MPSTRNIFAGICLTTLLGLINSAPTPSLNLDSDDTYPVQPLSGDATELPTTNLTLQYVAVGRGTQNYTCSGDGATPVFVGALANLYDATDLACDNITALHTFPPTVVYDPIPTTSDDLCTPDYCLEQFGQHYFDIYGTPIVNITTRDKYLYGAKTAAISAPSTADPGPAGTGAVPWLQLSPHTGYVSKEIQMVYRLVTAGGQSPACNATTSFYIDYSAEYWIYN